MLSPGTRPGSTRLATPRDPTSPGPAGSTLPRYIAVKAGGALISLAMVVVLGFFSFRILPGSDPAINLTRGRQVSAAEVERLRHEFGLDQSLIAQFFRYVGDLLTGNLGTSFVYNQSVSSLIAEKVGPTLLLTGTAARDLDRARAVARAAGGLAPRQLVRQAADRDGADLLVGPDVLARADPAPRLRRHAAPVPGRRA